MLIVVDFYLFKNIDNRLTSKCSQKCLYSAKKICYLWFDRVTEKEHQK